ncbi:NUDIX hydrolase [Streptomyces platensis]|uniref:NUDIX hydrolase n=2 Tax=Streptomyces platensis TaxID=58346 RepID=A0AAE6NPG5_STRPT|nr:NUDIX hydrolase [Streptomyces platensis]QEV55565.1 NUDIX hydrolase [Streptomyces platensis]BCK67310.1 ADP-ribose pyrophosphatase [Streptomyces libani subsp. rufus]
MTTMDYAAYIAGLPRVIAGAGTLFRDAEGRLLLVEPNYRDTWLLPGGTVEADAGESPRQAARRETAEEIGLDIEPGALLAVDWVRGKDRPPLVSYLYDGGVLDAAQLSAIRVQESELLSWRMVHWDEAQTLVNREIALRVGAALKALAAGRGPAELEDGVPPNGYDGPSK